MTRNISLNKVYLKSQEFWNTPHNKKMEQTTIKLLNQRDLLSNLSKQHPQDYFQLTDGSLRIQKREGFFSFLKKPSKYTTNFVKEMNLEYQITKEELRDIAEPVRKALHTSK